MPDITREKAIDLLDNLIGMIEDNHNSDYDTALKMAIKALEQLPDWIPISERLPEDGERVLVTHSNRPGVNYFNIVIQARWDLMRYCFFNNYGECLDNDFVCAWMPLPAPYKIESEVEKNA